MARDSERIPTTHQTGRASRKEAVAAFVSAVNAGDTDAPHDDPAARLPTPLDEGPRRATGRGVLLVRVIGDELGLIMKAFA